MDDDTLYTNVGQIGPGSQPPDPDGAESLFMSMPADMSVYQSPAVPEPEDARGLEAAIGRAHELQRHLAAYRVGDPAIAMSLDDLDDANLKFFDNMLGEGEVSVRFDNGSRRIRAQESVLAGVWRVFEEDAAGQVISDSVEVADICSAARTLTFVAAGASLEMDQEAPPEGVYNAPPLLTEIADKLRNRITSDGVHTINLSLLPHTEADIEYLSARLGIGPTIILSRGYGNCRISSTGTQHVWWVQYFNSQDTLILNTLEVSVMPSVACAAQDDVDESAERLETILSIYVVDQ